MGPADFLTLLWGDTPPGLIQIWQLDGKRSSYYQSPAGAIVMAGRVDAYTGVALAHKNHGRDRRARADQALAIAGLWLDIDINGGPDQKTGAAPNLQQAELLANTIAPPTVLVHSGYGLHAWHVFPEPWVFTSREEQHHAATASAQWFELHRQAANRAGFTIDHAHDLARLMRLPGTFNGKGVTNGQNPDGAPVTATATGEKHPRETLLQLAAQAGDVAVNHGHQLELASGTPLEVRHLDEIPPKIDALLFNDTDFAATWNHERSENWSLSEYDMSLCNQAARAGFTDQDLADLIGLHRTRYGNGKGGRRDYLRRTIAKAREGAARSDAANELAQLRRAA